MLTTIALWVLFVVGISTSFQGISSQGSAGLAAVSTGISELIVETIIIVPVAALGAWIVVRLWQRFGVAGRRS